MSAVAKSRIDPEVKRQAEAVLEEIACNHGPHWNFSTSKSSSDAQSRSRCKPSGHLKVEVRMEQGEAVERKVWDDGAKRPPPTL